MRERHEKDKAELRERRDKIVTSGGPTQNAEDVEMIKKKFKNQQLLTKISLEKQREMEENERAVKRRIEVE